MWRSCSRRLRPQNNIGAFPGPFAELSSIDVNKLCGLLSHPRSRHVTDKDALKRYNRDWMNQVEGRSTLALCPASTAEVSAILKYCSEHRLAVCPQGGNTGLVYGSTPVADEVILSLERMNSAPEVHASTMSATCEAGVILQTLHDEAKAHGFLVPLDMGSRGSCLIGGNLATNAGGIHFARYGSMRANCLGLEVVTASGEVLDMMSPLRKDNAGYDVKQWFIGSEGTLGVITRAELKLHPYPNSVQVALLQVRCFEDVLKMFSCATKDLCECLSAFEVMDAESLTCAPFQQYPFANVPGSFTVLVETHGADESHDFAKLERFVTACDDAGVTTLGQVLSQSMEQTRKLWTIREELPVKLAQSGTIYKFDVSFPLHRFYDIVHHVRRAAREDRGIPLEDVLIVGYGHFGDGNVHLNVVDRTRGKHAAALHDILYPGVYEQTAKVLQGSISAEHGIGRQKMEYLSLSRSPAVQLCMKNMKRMMDPEGILNPHKVLSFP